MKKNTFFMTSNIGGGGGTVSRLFRYLPRFNDLVHKNIGILFNYHYLSFFNNEGLHKTKRMIFDKSKLEYLCSSSIDFYDFIKILSGRESHEEQISDFPVLLDSGAGKILADSIMYYDLDYQSSKDLIFNLSEPLIKFAINKNSKYVIAMDYCYKNTYKNSEGKSEQYKSIIRKLSSDTILQNELLHNSMDIFSKYKSNMKLLAPIHGTDENSFINHYESIISLESRTSKKFDGFALGGLSIFRDTYGKKISSLIKKIRALGEDRHIHILGSAGIKKIIPMILAGADSFDCHTPWRRANEDYEIMIPLLLNDKRLNNSDDVFKNISVNKLDSESFFCDFGIFDKFSLKEIKEFINNRKKDPEKFHLAKILIYIHAIYQYGLIFEHINSMRDSNLIESFIESINQKELRNGLMKACI